MSLILHGEVLPNVVKIADVQAASLVDRCDHNGIVWVDLTLLFRGGAELVLATYAAPSFKDGPGRKDRLRKGLDEISHQVLPNSSPYRGEG